MGAVTLRFTHTDMKTDVVCSENPLLKSSLDMQTANHTGMAHDNRFFDITHTFKSGSSTYHVLGLRKDRPTYKNTYYIFHCTDAEHEATNDVAGKVPSLKRPPRTSEQLSLLKRRPLTVHHTTATSMDGRITISANRPRKAEAPQSQPRARSVSPAAETAVTKEAFDKALRADRQMLIASFRKEMNSKKKTLLRSIRKDKQELLQATVDANNKEDIIRSLQEQNSVLTKAYDQFVSTTTSSIDALKRTLIDMLESQHNTVQSTEQIQLTMMQTIEQEVQKITLKNEEILQSTSADIDAISQLQETLVRKIDHFATVKKHSDTTTLSHLFSEQQQAFTHIVEQQQQQQQTSSVDLIKEAMHDVLNQQRKTSINHGEHHPSQTTETTTDVTFSHAMTSNTIHSLRNMKPDQAVRTSNQSLATLTSKSIADRRFFKVSIRSPEPAHLYAKLVVDGMECPRRAHTLCQRDALQSDLYNCYIAPPTKDGPYELTIYAKTSKERTYRAAICIRIPGANISQSIAFPTIHQSFEEHQCILIEPLQRLLRRNEQVLIHMIVPGAVAVKIRNGDENLELDANEYKKDVVKKKIRVRGNVCVTGCWEKKAESTLCAFNMV